MDTAPSSWSVRGCGVGVVTLPSPADRGKSALLERAKEMIRSADAAHRDAAAIGNSIVVAFPSISGGYHQPRFSVRLLYEGREKLARERTEDEEAQLDLFVEALLRAGRVIESYMGMSFDWQELEFEGSGYKVKFVN